MTVNLSYNNSVSMITALSKLNPFDAESAGFKRKNSSPADSSSSSSGGALKKDEPSPPLRRSNRQDGLDSGYYSAKPSANHSQQETRGHTGPKSESALSPLPSHSRKELLLAEKSVQKLVVDSKFFPQEAAREDWFRRADDIDHVSQRGQQARAVTTLYEHELHVDQILGKGGFCQVRLARLKGDNNREYALKYLQPCGKSKSAFSRGAADLAIEARFLSLLRHENIISLHYVSGGTFAEAYNCMLGAESFGETVGRDLALPPLRHYGYFLVLDYLRDTLLQRIQNRYIPAVVARGICHPKAFHAKHKCHYGEQYHDAGPKDEEKNCEHQVHWWNKRLWQRNCEDENHRKMMFLSGSLAKRLGILRQVASALEYLHKNGIVYRDVKPDNIGFYFKSDHFSKDCDECEGIPKLFDFGLVKELKASLRSRSVDDYLNYIDEDNVTFKLTGRTGSRRYMAPEVAFYKPYNLKADVYSFGILLYETATLLQPFDGYSLHRHEEEALRDGKRPCLMGYAAKSCSGGYFPKDLKPLIEECWDGDMKNRPTMSEVVKRLDLCLSELGEFCVSCGDTLNSSNHEEVSCTSPLHACKGVVRGKRKGFLFKVNFPSAA